MVRTLILTLFVLVLAQTQPIPGASPLPRLGLLLVLALVLWLLARKDRSAGTSSAPGGVGPAKPAGEPISFSCPDCGKHLRGRAEQAGKKFKCSGCGRAVLVPGGATP